MLAQPDNGLDDGELLNMTYLELSKLLNDTAETTVELRTDNMLLDNYMQSLVSADSDSVLVERKPKYKMTKQRKADDVIAEFVFPEDYSYDIYLSRDVDKFLIEQKCEIAANGIEITKEKLFALHENSFNAITPYKVKMEALILESTDLRLERSNFTRLLSKGANLITGKLSMEKVTRYFKHSLRRKEMKLERCRLDHMALVELDTKIEANLLRQADFDDSLTQITCDQLKMENSLFSSYVDDRNRVLFGMKYLLSSMVQRLHQQKMKLKQLTTQDIEMKQQVEIQRNKITDIEQEIQRVQNEVGSVKRRVRHLKYQLDNYRFPDVMDYILVQAQSYELNKILKDWRRRVSIASRSLDAKLKFSNRLKKKCNINKTRIKLDTEEDKTSSSETASSTTFY